MWTPLFAHQELSCGLDEDDSVLLSVQISREVSCGVISAGSAPSNGCPLYYVPWRPVDEPGEDFRHQGEVGGSKVFNGDQSWITQGPHHLSEVWNNQNNHMAIILWFIDYGP